MKCPRCQAENDLGARFCEDCGARLEAACPSCGTPVTPGKKFCRSCGAALITEPAGRFASPESYTPRHLAERFLNSKAALEGERKHVTVLFADLKGSMELLADRDPEEARKILDPVLQRMMEAVHRYEGTVNQVMGDGIMALFGAPLAHEDHAVRACYAALRMQEQVRRYAEDARRAHGVNVQIRVGLNSGEVVVRTIGSDLRMDYTAIGQTTHLAARMEQLASPGSILLTPSTLELVEGFVGVRPLGSIPVKGLARPVEIYEVTGAGPARTRLQAAARRGLTRFVGREAEMAQLRHAQDLAATGHGQVVAIVGEAGVGKSRLISEFSHSHRLQGWLVLESAGVSYGKATSYFPVINLLRVYFKIQDPDALSEIREKVMGTLLALDEALNPTLPALLSLLDVPVDDAEWQRLDPGQRRQRTFDAVRRLLLRQAREQPLLVIFEDLQWIDRETQALLDGLIDSLDAIPLLLLANYRPGYQHPWGTKALYRQLRMDVLPAEGAAGLLETLLGDDAGLAPLKQLLAQHGNPFFLEETVRSLVETQALAGERGRYRLTGAVLPTQVPPSVQAILAARIDRLAPEDKRLLQIASVIGKDVPFALLRAVAELPDDTLRVRLDHLQAAEFLYETRLFPDLQHSFTHALTHEVTYGSLLQERRRELHARIVVAIEALHGDRLGAEIERLAHHAFRGELRETAVVYLRQAGLRAAARSALSDARGWFEQALGILGMQAASQATLEQAFEINLELRGVLTRLGEPQLALEHLREAGVLADRLDDDARRCLIHALMTSTYALLGELDEAVMVGTRALDMARRLQDHRLRILTTTQLRLAYYYQGEYERGIALATDGLETWPSDVEYLGLRVSDRALLVMSLAHLGRFAEAAPFEAEATRLAEATDRAFTVGFADLAAGLLHISEGAWAKAHSRIERGLARFRAGDISLMLPTTMTASSWVLAELGEVSEAQTRLRESLQLLDGPIAKGIVGQRGWSYRSLGRACLRLGRLDEARDLAERAVEFSQLYPGFAAHALHLRADVATHPDCFDAASGEAYYLRTLALAEPRGMRPLVAHCHLGLGKLCRRTGKRQETQEHLTTATTMYREMDMRFWLEEAAAEMGA